MATTNNTTNTNLKNPYQIEEEFTNLNNDIKDYIQRNGIYNNRIINYELFKEKMEKKYDYLMSASPNLLKKCLNKEFIGEDKSTLSNLNRVQEMFTNMKRIYNGEIDKKTVDIRMGKKYFNEFVKPSLDKEQEK